MYKQTSNHPYLELITQVLNINLGYNEELMKKCRTLHDYAVFVDLVHRNWKGMPLEQAVEQAIDSRNQQYVPCFFFIADISPSSSAPALITDIIYIFKKAVCF